MNRAISAFLVAPNDLRSLLEQLPFGFLSRRLTVDLRRALCSAVTFPQDHGDSPKEIAWIPALTGGRPVVSGRVR